MSKNNGKPVIFLAFANDQQDYLHNLKVEQRRIRTALQKAEQAGLCEVVYETNTSINDILDVFQRYQDRIAVFHYGGHASDYLLLLETADGERSLAHSEGLVSFLAQQKGLKFVFINGCSSRQQAEDLVAAGVPAVVGTAQPIDDAVATDLSERFYRGLASGITLERAWKEAVDQVKIKKGKSEFRAVYPHGKFKSVSAFPWSIYYREGAEIVKKWSLPEAAENPLFGLPEIPPKFDLPEMPCLFLQPYKRHHAEIFFGRSYYIRDLYHRIHDKNSPPIVLLYGQSGAGKSSLFDAGLNPRLETGYQVAYIRRIRGKGAAGTLAVALNELAETLPDTTAVISETTDDTPSPPAVTSGYETALEQLETLAANADESLRQEVVALMDRLKSEQDKQTSQPVEERTSASDTTTTTLDAEKMTPGQLWLALEERIGKPVVIILDQVEEIFTRPNAEQPDELARFCDMLSSIFSNPSDRPRGKLVLGYRKEFHPEFEEQLKERHLPRSTMFMEHLKRKDILDIFRGLSETPALAKRYHLTVEEDLPVMIADDLLEDKDSPVAPVLQILLTKMWNGAYEENPAAPRFSVALYQHIRKEGLAMGEFFAKQMSHLQQWRPDVVDSGLAMDVLHLHTTELGTSGVRGADELKTTYAHRPEILNDLLNRCKALYLLSESQRSAEYTSLSHDTLAPVVIQEYHRSDKPGQRAARVLGNKMPDFWRDEKTVWLDDADLEIVEAGTLGMRQLSEKEKKLLEISRQKKAEREQLRKRLWIGGMLMVAAIIISSIFAVISMNKAELAAKRAKSNLFAMHSTEIRSDDHTVALRLAETAYAHHKTLAAQKSLLNTFYKAAEQQEWFYKHYLSHPAAVKQVTLSPDESKLLTVAEDHKIRLWTINGELINTFGHDTTVYSAIFSPNGDYVLSASEDATARLWTGGGDSVAVLKHLSNVYSAVFSPGGDKILTASDDGMAMLWQLDGEKIKSFDHHSVKDAADQASFLTGINQAIFSPDGSRIITVGRDATARIWDLDTELGRASLSGQSPLILQHDLSVYSAQFSLDGNFILTGSYDGFACLWTASGDTVRRFPHTIDGLIPKLSPGGDHVFVSDDKGLGKIWQVDGDDNWERIDARTYGGFTFVQFIDEKQQMLTALWDKTARVWNEDGEEVAVCRHPDVVDWATMTRDGRRLITASRDMSVRIWQAAATADVSIEHPGYSGVRSADISQSGAHIASGTENGDVYIWSGNGEQKAKMSHTDAVLMTTVSPDESQILTASRDKTARLWSIHGAMIVSLPHDSTVYSAKFSPDGEKILTASLDGAARLWSAQGELLKIFSHDGWVISANFSPDGATVLTASGDSTARLWAANGDLLTTFRHDSSLFSAVFSPDGEEILTTSWDKTARLWTTDGDSLATYAHNGTVSRAIFSPDGEEILTTSWDYTARLWEKGGKQLTVLAHYDWVVNAAFSPDGEQLLTISDDNTAKLWSLDGEVLATFEHSGAVTSGWFTSDGLQIATASSDGTVYLWKTAEGIFQWLKDTPVYQLTEKDRKQFNF